MTPPVGPALHALNGGGRKEERKFPRVAYGLFTSQHRWALGGASENRWVEIRAIFEFLQGLFARAAWCRPCAQSTILDIYPPRPNAPRPMAIWVMCRFYPWDPSSGPTTGWLSDTDFLQL